MQVIMSRFVCISVTLLVHIIVLHLDCVTCASAKVEFEATQSRFRHPYQLSGYQGCAACRGYGNCTEAVNGKYPGVYCGDLITTYQPCCCTYRNECSITIFSDTCECLTEDQVERISNTRLTVFCVISGVVWALWIYEKMCGQPYKVMNSNPHQHHHLPNTPSAAQDSAPRDSLHDGDEELNVVDDDVGADSYDDETTLMPSQYESSSSIEPTRDRVTTS